jgi:hypothetical protein
VFLFDFAITLAIVNVFPLPVTPSKVCRPFFEDNPLANFLIASG